MREKTARTLRRGPEFPLPVETSESTYYSIDTTEDIYGTTLLPSQRCYVDPWDLENYDYVRKKIDPTPESTSFYDTSMSPSPAGEPVPTQYFYMQKPGNFDCADCYRQLDEEALFNTVKYDDYPERDQLRMGNSTYRDFGSSSPSSERNSSCEEDSVATLRRHQTKRFEVSPRKRGLSVSRIEPTIDYPSGPYDYCSPYGETTPYASVCSGPDCYECISQNNNALLYSSPPSIYESSFYGSTLGRRSESLYSNTYGNRFGLSKKGLLQIDYSCSWNDLDRVIGRHF